MPDRLLAPWHEGPWSTLYQRYRDGKLPHAVLINGVDGIGQRVFANHIADALLCEELSKQAAIEGVAACGKCSACQLRLAGSHPDLKEVAPLEGDAFIKVDAIRDLIQWMQLTPQYEGNKIAIVDQAHAMNRNAANSLLKTLEEPSARAFIMLLSDAATSMPATVRSRCQKVTLKLTDTAQAVDWLRQKSVPDPEVALSLARNGPFLALELAESDYPEQRQRLLTAWRDIVLGKASIERAVESIKDLPTQLCLRTFSSWTTDLARMTTSSDAPIGHEPDRETLLSLCGALKTEDWFSLYDQMLKLYRIDSTSFKTHTVLEGLFADIRLRYSTV
ncbi:MAG: DNA polymerase III subunit delta' [Gammaproteobacteria bacterium]|nr:DNA polymerase III subunit delta' [Gammaproteobacteria bacterium]